jgi:hypothetical protein
LRGIIRIQAIVIRIPPAGIRGVGRVDCVERRPGNGQVPVDRLPGYAANNVNTEFEPLQVNPIGKRLEAGRKSILRWEITAVVIQNKALRGALLTRIPKIPALIPNHILPAKRLQMLV